MSMHIEIANIADADEILALQKLAFQTEAALYDDYTIPPLHQTLESLQAEIRKLCVLKAIFAGRIVGSVRANVKNGICYINRLMVHPEHQKQGIGACLMQEIEKHFASAERYQLGTGYLSVDNLRFYHKLGYREIGKEKLSEKVTLVVLAKAGILR